MSNEVKARFTADSTSYEQALSRLSAGHTNLITNEDRAGKAVEEFTKNLILSESAGDALVASLNRIDKMLNLTGRALLAFSVGQAVIEATQRKLGELEKSLEKVTTAAKEAAKTPLGRLNDRDTGALNKGAEAQLKALDEVARRQDEIRKGGVFEEVGSLITGGEVGGSVEKQRLQELELTLRDNLLSIENALADKVAEQTGVMALQLNEQTRAARLAQARIQYAEKITATESQGRMAEAEALREQLAMQEAIINKSEDKAAQAKINAREDQNDANTLAALRYRGDDAAVQRAELQFERQKRMRDAEERGIVGLSGLIATEYQFKERLMEREEQKRLEEIAAQRQLNALRGSTYAREDASYALRVARLKEQIKLEADGTKRLQLENQLGQLEQARFDREVSRAKTLRSIKAEALQLDIDFAKRNDTESDRSLAKRKAALESLAEEARNAADDPEALARIGNQVRALRNEIAQPINQTNFTRDSKRAIGAGGNIGSGGDPALAQSRQQTTLLGETVRLLNKIEETLKKPVPATRMR